MEPNPIYIVELGSINHDRQALLAQVNNIRSEIFGISEEQDQPVEIARMVGRDHAGARGQVSKALQAQGRGGKPDQPARRGAAETERPRRARRPHPRPQAL